MAKTAVIGQTRVHEVSLDTTGPQSLYANASAIGTTIIRRKRSLSISASTYRTYVDVFRPFKALPGVCCRAGDESRRSV